MPPTSSSPRSPVARCARSAQPPGAEYKKYIEKDPALTRRFQTVKIDEPSEDKAVLMLRGIVTTMEKHHRVQILDEALVAAAKLSIATFPIGSFPTKP